MRMSHGEVTCTQQRSVFVFYVLCQLLRHLFHSLAQTNNLQQM